MLLHRIITVALVLFVIDALSHKAIVEPYVVEVNVFLILL
jgi:hypothetical protein